MLKFIIASLCWVGWANGMLGIAFGWLIASGNALPSATGSLLMCVSIAAWCYLSAVTLALVKHA